MKLRDLRIGTKLAFGFGIIVILSFALGAAGLIGLKTVHDKSANLVRIRDIQKGFTEARLYLRTFSALKDTQFYVRSQKSMTHVIGLLDSLKLNLNGKGYTEMIGDLEKGLKDYASLSVLNKKMILTQFEIVNQLNEKAGQFKSEMSSSGIPQTSLANFYFIQSLEHIRSIELNPSEENYQDAKGSLEMSLKELTRMKKDALISIVNLYLSEIDRFMEAAKSNKEIDPQQLTAGKKALESADRMGSMIDNDVDQTKKATTFFLIVFGLVTLALGIIISFFITRYFTVMLRKGVHLAETYASGELTIQIPAEDLAAKDEIGDLARAMVAMGNKIKEVVTSISQEAAIVSTASEQISSTTMQLSESSNEQASSIEEVSSSMEEMASNIMQNTENAGIAESITSLSAEMIREVAHATQNSLISARKITGKIGVINDIAFQTNILALNAAVEAARAGEQGKGFAVVASEVRKLAEHSKTAAGEIIELTQASLKATEEAEALMMKVLPDIEKSAMLIKEISSASVEQNAGADQVNNAVQQLNQITQENASSAEELASSAEELAQEAEKLKAVTAYFKVEINHKPESKKMLIKTREKEKQHKTSGKRPAFTEKPGKGVFINLENSTNDSQYEKF